MESPNIGGLQGMETCADGYSDKPFLSIGRACCCFLCQYRSRCRRGRCKGCFCFFGLEWTGLFPCVSVFFCSSPTAPTESDP